MKEHKAYYLMSKAQRKRARRKLRAYDGGARARQLRGFPDPRRFATPEMKKAILERDMYRCRYCETEVTFRTSNIDHVIPWFEGGVTDRINLVTACKPCNAKKGPHMGKMKPMELQRHRKKFLPPEALIEISPDIYEEWHRQNQHLKSI